MGLGCSVGTRGERMQGMCQHKSGGEKKETLGALLAADGGFNNVRKLDRFLEKDLKSNHKDCSFYNVESACYFPRLGITS